MLAPFGAETTTRRARTDRPLDPYGSDDECDDAV